MTKLLMRFYQSRVQFHAYFLFLVMWLIQNTSVRVWNLVLLVRELEFEFKLGNLLAIFVGLVVFLVILASSRGVFTVPMFSSFKLEFNISFSLFKAELWIMFSLDDRFILWPPNPKPLKNIKYSSNMAARDVCLP